MESVRRPMIVAAVASLMDIADRIAVTQHQVKEEVEIVLPYHSKYDELATPVDLVEDYPTPSFTSNMNQRKRRKLARQNPHSKYNR